MIQGVGGRQFPIRMPQELPGLDPAQAGQAGAPGRGFVDAMKDVVGEANHLQLRAEGLMDAFVRGEVADLHTVALAQQEAGIAMRLVVEMRDKLLQSYQEVMRMSM